MFDPALQPPSSSRAIGKSTPVELGMLVILVSAVASGAWTLRGIASDVAEHGRAITELKAADAQQTQEQKALREQVTTANANYAHILRSIEELRSEMRVLFGRAPAPRAYPRTTAAEAP